MLGLEIVVAWTMEKKSTQHRLATESPFFGMITPPSMALSFS